MIFREEVQRRLDDYNGHGELTLNAAIKLFENVGSHHSDEMKDSLIAGTLGGTALLVTEWRVESDLYPKYSDRIFLETWITGKAPSGQIHRNFRMMDKDGNILICATADLVLIDVATKRLMRITQPMFDLYKPEGNSIFDTPLTRLIPPTAFETEKTFALRKADIDYNGHVHNTKYLDFAYEILPDADASPRKTRIQYRKPLLYGDDVTLKLTGNGNEKTVCVFHNDGTLCTVLQFGY